MAGRRQGLWRRLLLRSTLERGVLREHPWLPCRRVPRNCARSAPRSSPSRRRAVRHLLLPVPPGTSTSAPVSSGRAKSSRDSGVRTPPRPRAHGCDSLLLVAWKAPAGVLGNGAIFVANKPRYLWSLLPRLGTPVAIFSTPARHDRRRIRGRTSGCRIVPTATMAISKNHPLFWELAPLSPKLGGQELRSFNSNLISGG